jgi:hypothetical protein
MATQQSRSNLVNTIGVGSLRPFRSVDGASVIGANDNNTAITLANSSGASKDITFEDADKCMGTVVDLNVVASPSSDLVIKGVKSGVVTLNKNTGSRGSQVSNHAARNDNVTIGTDVVHAKLEAICDGSTWYLVGFLMIDVPA